jgi:ketosteroid isomerase-like protein
VSGLPDADVDGVRRAAGALLDAFGRNDLAAYFACFHPDATFLFHSTDRLLTSTADYRRLWEGWEREDGFRVLECATTDTHVQLLGDTAVLTHSVRTTVSTSAGREVLRERETIVFRRGADGRWLGVHEHLSPAP